MCTVYQELIRVKARPDKNLLIIIIFDVFTYFYFNQFRKKISKNRGYFK